MPTGSNKARDCTLEVKGQRGQKVTIRLGGRLSLDNSNFLKAQIQETLRELAPQRLTVDLGDVQSLDSAGALLLVELQEQARDTSLPCEFVQVPEAGRRLLALIDPQALTIPPLKSLDAPGVLEQVGRNTVSLMTDLVGLLTFAGELLRALASAFLHPHRVRWPYVLFYMKRAGVDGLPILGLISLLLGLVMAFMSSLQLKQLGATVFVSSLVAIAMVKELGPLLTAILVAGRSGSAFAAEIGTMMVNEEVDALIVMGFSPMHFLALPKVLAAMVVVPLLAAYAMLIGILGGLVVGVTLLDLTLFTYVNETQKAIDLFDLLSSLFKSLVFAAIVAAVGCQRGFQVRGGAEAVGTRTTSAVVTGIFLIILVDALFAVALHYLR